MSILVYQSSSTLIKGETLNPGIKGICELLQVRKTRTTPYHPQSDGMVERFNRTLLNLLSLSVSENERDWDVKLPVLLFAYEHLFMKPQV